ncbi:MAG TPA: collagen-like protein [Gemmataceae bacterium]|nr:collagen-like protein [Gemmataceae bacterium]
MNQRERLLAISVLTAIILAVGGFLFKWLFWDRLNRTWADIKAVKDEISKKEMDRNKEQDTRNALVRDDPRLSQWAIRSLPGDNNREAAIKSGHTPEEEEKLHEDAVQGDYARYLRELLEKSGFAANSITITPTPPENKGAPILSGKTPAYTRIVFTVKAPGKLDNVQRMMEDFYKTPLLHQIRDLKMTARTVAPTRTTPVAPVRAPGAPIGQPGAPAPAGIAGLPAPGGAAGRFGATGGFRSNAAPTGDLDVIMTVEALLVTGAQKRDELMPKSDDLKPKGKQAEVQVLAYRKDGDTEVKRRYSDILSKNVFTGIAASSQLKEDRDQILSCVRLTSLWTTGRHWQVSIFNQNKPLVSREVSGSIVSDDDKNEIPLNPDLFTDTFTVTDSYKNEVLSGKVVKVLSKDEMIFQAGKIATSSDGKKAFEGNGKYYRWHTGEYLGDRLANASDTAQQGGGRQRGGGFNMGMGGGDGGDDMGGGAPDPRYIRGALYTSMTTDELKTLGIDAGK